MSSLVLAMLLAVTPAKAPKPEKIQAVCDAGFTVTDLGDRWVFRCEATGLVLVAPKDQTNGMVRKGPRSAR